MRIRLPLRSLDEAALGPDGAASVRRRLVMGLSGTGLEASQGGRLELAFVNRTFWIPGSWRPFSFVRGGTIRTLHAQGGPKASLQVALSNSLVVPWLFFGLMLWLENVGIYAEGQLSGSFVFWSSLGYVAFLTVVPIIDLWLRVQQQVSRALRSAAQDPGELPASHGPSDGRDRTERPAVGP